MTQQRLNQKATRSANPTANLDAQADGQGIALAPPAYGIDLADNQPAQIGGAVALQRWAAPTPARDTAPSTQQPNRTGLPDALKSGIESLSGISMDDVRVRFNSSRPVQLGALAYTQGNQIHVAPGQARHLPHEAWHAVQQKQGRVRATMQLKGTPINDDAGLEHEADVMGSRAAQPKGATHDSRPALISATQNHSLAAVQRSAPARISAPIPAGGGSYRLVAGAGESQVGSVMVHAKDNAAIEVTDLGVDQAHREQGIGKLLIASAARTGRQLGKSTVALAAQDSGSGRLTQWYKRMGFAQVGLHQSGYPQLEAPIGRVLGGAALPRVVQRMQGGEESAPAGQDMKVKPMARQMIRQAKLTPFQSYALLEQVSDHSDATSLGALHKALLEAGFLGVITKEIEAATTQGSSKGKTSKELESCATSVLAYLEQWSDGLRDYAAIDSEKKDEVGRYLAEALRCVNLAYHDPGYIRKVIGYIKRIGLQVSGDVDDCIKAASMSNLYYKKPTQSIHMVA